jgi:tetratricopeptide (TPR) repeat protein
MAMVGRISTGTRDPRPWRWSWVLGLQLLGLLAFAPALWGGFVYDDRRDILVNPAARADSFLDRLSQTVRPLLKASYALQDALTGHDPLAFHAVNLALHLGAILLLFALVARAGRAAGVSPPAADRLAGLTTGLWAAHPALAETVAYVSGRSMGLSAVLLLGCLLAATSARPRPWLAGGLALLAPLARETALVTPLLLLAWQVTVARTETRGAALRRALPVWLGAALAVLILALMARHRELVAFSLGQRGPLEALRANLFAIPEILRLWLEPARISVLPAQPVTYGWTDPPTLLRLAVLGALPVLALALRCRAPLVALAVLWTLLALAPTNSLIWRVDPVAVRPLYLAGIGVSLLLALVLCGLRGAGLALAAALVLGLGLQARDRATLYQDEVALFADAAAKAPEDARAQTMLGLVLANAGRVEEARSALSRALALDPYRTEAAKALRVLDAGGGVSQSTSP